MYKVNSKGIYKYSQCLLVKISSQQQITIGYCERLTRHSFILTAAREAPVPENKIFSLYLRLFPPYALTEKSQNYAGILGSGLEPFPYFLMQEPTETPPLHGRHY